MDISKAALPPIQPSVSEATRAHPRYGKYAAYVGQCSCMLIEAMNFDAWLRETERTEWEARNWEDHCFEVDVSPARRAVANNPDLLENGWYKHRFAPGHKLANRFGPFPTREAAEASGAQ